MMDCLFNNILVEEIAEEEAKTESGLIIASSDRALSKLKKGLVISCGGEVYSINVGDTIYYYASAGIPFSREPKRTILKNEDVVGKEV